MKNLLVLSLTLFVLTTPGCASSKYNLPALAGMNISDLESAKDKGLAKTFGMSLDTAFDETLNILKAEQLTVFRSSKKKGYIIAMGFKEQVDTTRVGIFFETISADKTKITISCLSLTALPKAEKIVFGGLSKASL